MDIEQKVSLIQQIHREQEENERYIYDNLQKRKNHKKRNGMESYPYEFENYDRNDSWRMGTQISWMASFRFRLLVAVLLFICFFVMDKKELTYKEVGSNQIVQYISENMELEYLLSNRPVN